MVIMNAIKREIFELSPDIEAKVLPYDDRFRDEVLGFGPDVIMTFPMTSVGLSQPYYILKSIFGTKVVCFRAEGIIDPASPHSVANHVGYDQYGSSLVDCEIFWGPGPAKLIGQELLAQKKISSAERIKCFGYPRLERYFGLKLSEEWPSLPGSIDAKLAAFGPTRTILVATGFHFANYTREMIFAAKDLDAENRCVELLEIIEEVKAYRASWINSLRQAAEENPDFLFVLKKHPIERMEDYSAICDIDNVLYVYQDVDIGDLIERAGLFIHYGSTSLADAYLAHVPAVYVYSRDTRCRNWFPDMGWPSARSVPSDQIAEVVREFRAGKIAHNEDSPAVRSVLEFNFNIRDGEAYCPSRQIAELLLQDDKAQPVPLSDKYLWSAFAKHYYARVRRIIGRPLRRFFRLVLSQFH